MSFVFSFNTHRSIFKFINLNFDYCDCFVYNLLLISTLFSFFFITNFKHMQIGHFTQFECKYWWSFEMNSSTLDLDKLRQNLLEEKKKVWNNLYQIYSNTHFWTKHLICNRSIERIFALNRRWYQKRNDETKPRGSVRIKTHYSSLTIKPILSTPYIRIDSLEFFFIFLNFGRWCRGEWDVCIRKNKTNSTICLRIYSTWLSTNWAVYIVYHEHEPYTERDWKTV